VGKHFNVLVCKDSNVLYNNVRVCVVKESIVMNESSKNFNWKVFVIGAVVAPLVVGIFLLEYEKRQNASQRVVLENLPEVLSELKNDPDSGYNMNRETTEENLTSRERSIEVTAPQAGNASYLLDKCPPYDYESYWNDSFSMGGVKYNNGFYLKTFVWQPFVLFNLSGKFSEISGMVGHVDGTAKENTTLKIYYDGELVNEIEINWDNLPQKLSIDITGVMQLKIVNDNGFSGVGFGEMKII